MKKKELKKFLKRYFKVRDAIEKKRGQAEINLYGRKKKIECPVWSGALSEHINELYVRQCKSVEGEIIKLWLYEGKSDREIIGKLPIADSTYYRYKFKLIQQLYELLIIDGYVDKGEILDQTGE